MTPRLVPVADHALLVELADEISDEANRTVVALDRAITAANIVGVREVVPAMVNLLIDFDPVATDHVSLEASVRALVAETSTELSQGRQHRALVCYEADYGPDLGAVAAVCGMSTEGVIEAHLAGDYRVYMYGFAPGYAYLAGVPEAIHVPRKPAAVRDVPAVSVLIAGPQCLITTLDMPTGWSIIGRSATRVLRADSARPFLFDVGDSIMFERADVATFERATRTSD